MRAVLTNFLDNPILTRELRRRMRGRALIFSIIGYIALMTLATILVLVAKSPKPFAQMTLERLEQLSQTGDSLFLAISMIQFLLVLIIAPTITAGMTTAEKERKTFDFLRVTTITPWMYITGCFLSTVFYVALALICAFPLLSLVFVYGGVTTEELFGMFFLLLGGSLILSAFGLYVSSIRERTRTAQGIIVFSIFSLLFAGVFAYNFVTTKFNLNAASMLDLYWHQWMAVAGLIGIVTWVFLLLATRKLFEPELTRAFSHWQFIVLGALLMVPQVAAAKGVPISEPQALAFLLSGQVLLLVAVMCFAVGRMEVGDEIWQVKRLVPVLRPFDQTVPYLIAVGVIWYATVRSYYAASAGVQTAGALADIVLLVGLTGYAAACALGRLATAHAVGRDGASAITATCLVAFWGVAPIIGYSWRELLDAPNYANQFLIMMSPFMLLFDSVGNPDPYKSTGGMAHPAVLVAGLYATAFVVLLVVGEVMRHRRWKAFNYHYDMPAR